MMNIRQGGSGVTSVTDTIVPFPSTAFDGKLGLVLEGVSEVVGGVLKHTQPFTGVVTPITQNISSPYILRSVLTIADKYLVDMGLLEKNASDDVTLVAGDVVNFVTTAVNMDYVIFSSTITTGSVTTGNFARLVTSDREINSYVVGNPDQVTNYWKYYFATGTTNLRVVFPKGTFADITAARAYFAGTKLIYQLATPVIVSNFATNIVANGNFASTTGWSAYASTLSASNNILSVSGTGADRSAEFYRDSSTFVNKRLYIRLFARVTNSSCSSISVSFSGGTTISEILNPVANQWYPLSGVVTNGNFNRLLIKHVYTNAATANGKVMEVSQVYAIDMGTAVAPTPDYNLNASQMLSKYPYFWDGSITNPFALIRRDGQIEYTLGVNSTVPTSKWRTKAEEMVVVG
jgi:hypothetical protein